MGPKAHERPPQATLFHKGCSDSDVIVGMFVCIYFDIRIVFPRHVALIFYFFDDTAKQTCRVCGVRYMHNNEFALADLIRDVCEICWSLFLPLTLTR